MTRIFAALVAACVVSPAISAAAERLNVRVASVAPSDGATVLTYVLANGSSRPYALVRVDCEIRNRAGASVDQASDVTENLGARQSVQGQAYFNTAEMSPSTTFACRIDQAYR
jgi:hypothetical protein